MSDLQISKTYTSNAFLDYILYYVKKMAFNSVVKDEDEALALIVEAIEKAEAETEE